MVFPPQLVTAGTGCSGMCTELFCDEDRGHVMVGCTQPIFVKRGPTFAKICRVVLTYMYIYLCTCVPVVYLCTSESVSLSSLQESRSRDERCNATTEN